MYLNFKTKPKCYQFSASSCLTERSQTQSWDQITFKLLWKIEFLKLLENSIYLFLANDLECGRIFEVLGLAFVDGRVVRLPFLSSHLLHVVPLSPNLYKQISITSLIQQIREETRFNYLQNNLFKTICRDVKRWNKALVLPWRTNEPLLWKTFLKQCDIGL